MAKSNRHQFTISAMLLLTVIAALGVLGWQKFIYVHPAHRNLSYEKASFTNSGSFTIHGNTVRIVSVARTDRDEQLLVENGLGKRIATAPANASLMKPSGRWLDTAQIQLKFIGAAGASVPPVEIIETRIFDHTTRQTLGTIDRSTGYRLVDPTTLQSSALEGNFPINWMSGFACAVIRKAEFQSLN